MSRYPPKAQADLREIRAYIARDIERFFREERSQ